MPIIDEIFEIAKVAVEVAGGAEGMGLGARLLVHNEDGLFDLAAKDSLRAFKSAFQLYESDAFFACFAQFDVTAPLGFENLRGGYAARWIGV